MLFFWPRNGHSRFADVRQYPILGTAFPAMKRPIPGYAFLSHQGKPARLF
jgi:hypothetical protein